MRRLLPPAAVLILALGAPTAVLPRGPTLEGTWRSTMGPMTFSQNDMAVTGRYTQPAGRFTGELRGRRLSGYWRQAVSPRRCHRKLDDTFYWGRLQLEFTGPDRFTGRWSYCDRPTVPGDGTWEGRRAAGPPEWQGP